MKKKWIFLPVVIGLGLLLYYHVPPNIPSIERWIMSVPRADQTPDEQKTLANLAIIDDHPFYQMTFYGNYPRYLEKKKHFYWAIGFPKPLCSSFAALSLHGHPIFGYNNDGEYQPVLLLFTDPPDGYASISISDLGGSLPGFTKTFTPFDSDRARSLLLYAPYFTQSGMNEMGLAVSSMTDPNGSWTIDPEKDTLGASEARRFILDHAKDVDEAISLLSQYNVSYAGTSTSHLLVADRSGHSALLEWVNGEMKVIRNQQPWQVSTNFQVYGAQPTIDAYTSEYQTAGVIAEDTIGRRYSRYVTAWETLKKAGGLLSPDQSMDLLSTVSLNVNTDEVTFLTQYSIVYDLVTGEVRIAIERNYQRIYRYQLPMK